MSDKQKKTDEKKKRGIWKVLLRVLLVPFVALAGVYIWIVSAPRSLEQFLPQIETSIEGELEGYDLQISEAYLHWGGFGEFVNVRTLDAKVYNLQGDEIANIPELDLDFKFLPLLIGELDPKNFLIKNTDVKIAGEELKVASFKAVFGDELAEFSGQVIYDGKPVMVRGNAQIGDGDNALTIFADAVNLKNFSNISPYLASADLLMDLRAEIDFVEHEPKKVLLSGSGLSGVVENEENLYDKLEVASGEFSAEYDLAEKKAALKVLDLAFVDGTKISLSGTAVAEDDFEVNIGIEQVEMQNLKKYWPKVAAPNAIEWIDEAVQEGTIFDAQARFVMNPWYLAEEGDGIPDEALSMQLNFSGFKVKYTDGLAPITSGFGRASMNMTTLTVDVDSAEIVDGKSTSRISNTQVKIDGIGLLPMETFEAKGEVEGSVVNLISFYERAHPKDAIVRAENITGGTAKTKAEVRFLLDKDLLLADIDVVLDSKISGASASGIGGDMICSGLDAKLVMNDKGYELDGNVNLQAKVDTEFFKSGMTPIKFNVSDKNNIEQYRVDADLTNAEILQKDLGIDKKKGQKAQANLVIRKRGQSADIQSFKFASTALSFDGEGVMKKDLSDFISLNFYSLSFANSKLSGKVMRDGAGKNAGYKVYMNGDYFNAEPLMEEAGDAVEDENSPPVYAELKFGRLGFAAGKELKDVEVSVYCKHGTCDKVDVKSDLLTVKKTAKNLDVRSENMGDVLLAFDIYEDMTGGKLTLLADIVDGEYAGDLKVSNFKVKESEFLLKLLTLGSLTGIGDLLQGNGISFDKLGGKFTYKSDVALGLKDMRAKGNSIGATVEGKVDLATEALDLHGKIIPAYSANTLLGKVPVLGDILIGDDGVFAFAYTVKGTVDKPEQQVNPLSVLAPGFLQKVFE